MGNIERNSYVENAIINSTVDLLKEKSFDEINIREITNAAQVSRNSFYRNFSSKESILQQHIKNLLTAWDDEYQASGKKSNPELFGSLFKHLKYNSNFYLLLRERGLFYLFRNVFLDIYGVKQELNNMEAYTVSFIMHGTLGWIEEWLNRGMQEADDDMAKLLSSYGMK